ncbi:hypothetical protein GLOIN_2v1695094 [Rhizophagus irregularis DAOM 181602=DAOM 197198]|uniref:Uncharacterized protein n=1 Tax=Rhizophagus irregularis (strain DAOM 181602 / DAOM 197198 / MUCL 43194) TaxID=747089 RepID=A0A2P4PB25_RHIID|nr:hypothetical protein GLOIN_2v1695094 [Rhizophagus irregularis DAOM 181602=DAOM 197198]POG62580.1 hypothetical protein GLOIN_2v1695094 [Rhizophagus irregularis DAOM 181602=DAOM 197198]GET59393.1 hypothetical protein GLOIN_2v1695094 [Rhizophagus irregularis DAOM 181602=DAOM 197198]|eukprot:XP_025169446.1 hypothetical protein GLOIN_2v1695094 [Rhizophagus irregularis DAOM 181602=DAOM 197198]
MLTWLITTSFMRLKGEIIYDKLVVFVLYLKYRCIISIIILHTCYIHIYYIYKTALFALPIQSYIYACVVVYELILIITYNKTLARFRIIFFNLFCPNFIFDK